MRTSASAHQDRTSESSSFASARFTDGATIDAHAIILASGVSYRQLTAPGVADFTGRGVLGVVGSK